MEITWSFRVVGRVFSWFVAGIALLLLLLSAPRNARSFTVSTGSVQEHLFIEGQRHHDEGNLDAAAELWSNVLSDSLYGPPAALLLARGFLSRQKPDRAEAELRGLLNKHGNGLYRDIARLLLAEVLFLQKKPEGVELLASLIARTSDRQVPSMTLKLAQLERHLEHYDKAAAHYRKLFLEFPASPEGLQAGEELAWMVVHGKVKKLDFTETEQTARARRLAANGRFDLAIDAYKALLPASPSKVKLKLKLAQCSFKDRRNQETIDLLKELLKGPLPPADRFEALYVLGRVWWRLDRYKEFELCCHEIVEKGPPALKRKALFQLGAFNLERGRLDLARQYLDRLLKSGPDQSLAVDAKWKMAWVKYRERQFKDAADLFRQTRAGANGGKIANPSRYWEARSLMQSGENKDAEPLLKQLAQAAPLDYYGLEAARLLKSLGAEPGQTVNGARSFPDVSLSPAQSSDPNVAAAGKLTDLGLHEFALLHLEALPAAMKSSPPIALAMAKAAYGADRYRSAHDILARSFPGFVDNPPVDAPPEFTEMAFPRIHRAEITKAAKKNAVDPHLVWAVIRQESRYDPSVVSLAGALGLMQVTPKAAGVVGKWGRIAPSAIAEIMEPKKNVAFGTRILAKNFSTFNGRLVPAVASYNADIRKVKSWVARNGKLPQDEFIESIPYLETRTYVKKVLAGYYAYTRLHEKKNLAGFW